MSELDEAYKKYNESYKKNTLKMNALDEKMRKNDLIFIPLLAFIFGVWVTLKLIVLFS